MIKVVLFDLDDTLYNEKDFVHGGFMSVSRYLGKKYGVYYNILYTDMLNILNTKGRGKIFDIICEKYNFLEDIDELVRVYRFHKPNITLYADAYEVLQKLKNMYKLGIITDGYNALQWNKIKALDIERCVDKIIVTDDYGKEYWKPSTKPFQIMVDYFNIKPWECIYIGDNPYKDFIPCKKLGMYSVRVLRQVGDYVNIFLDEKHEADYNIESLLELENILDVLNRGE